MCGHCLCVCLVQWEGNVANSYPIAMAISLCILKGACVILVLTVSASPRGGTTCIS